LYDRLRRGYAAGFFEDMSDGIEDSENPDVEGFVGFASDDGGM